MGKDDKINSSPEVVAENPVTPAAQTSSNYICHAEFTENGKLVHYLYNPDEKDPAKAWKKSDRCTN